MQDFDSVSASSTDPSALVEQLAEKSKEGWDVLAIVPTGGNVTAFLAKSAGGATMPAAAPAAPAAKPSESAGAASAPAAGAAAAGVTAGAVSEPAGWGSAPAAAGPSPAAPPAAATPPSSAPPASTTPSFQPANVTPGVVAPAQTGPAVPSGWYADPAGRYDLRYWDGKTWTEHVSRGGQQSTDPPTR